MRKKLKSILILGRVMILFLVLATSLIATSISYCPLKILAQSSSVNIVTSADDHGRMFFGLSAIQVVINDPSAESGGVRQATIPVTIVANVNEPEKKVTTSKVINTFDIPETAIGSGKFEFYLVHVDSFLSKGEQIHPINDAGVISSLANSNNETFRIIGQQQEQQDAGNGAPIITFGRGGELDTGSKIFEDASFEIIYGNEEIILNYKESQSKPILDRDIYSPVSTLNVFLQDQDANLNPTGLDKFTVAKDSLGSLFALEGGSFNPRDNITFLETGVNTAIFKTDFNLGNSIEATQPSLLLTLSDKANYQDVDAAENGNYTDTSMVSFFIQNINGKLIIPELVTFGSELKLSIDDFDQNKDSEHTESLEGIVAIAIQGNGGDYEIVNMSETATNSGLFIIDNPDNNLKLSFTNGTTKSNDGKLEFTSKDLHNFINVTYSDPLSDNGRQKSFTSMLKLHTTPGFAGLTPVPVLPPSSGQLNRDEFATLSINDPDLNDNSALRDAYSFTPSSNKSIIPLKRGSTDLSEFAQIQINTQGGIGNNASFPFNDTITLIETASNSSIFEAGIPNGDSKVEYLDNMERANMTTSLGTNTTGVRHQ